MQLTRVENSDTKWVSLFGTLCSDGNQRAVLTHVYCLNVHYN